MRNLSARAAGNRVVPGRPSLRPLVATFLLVAAGSASAVGGGIMIADASAVQDALASRSPGARTGASMSKGKARSAAAAAPREARALPRVRDQGAALRPPVAGGILAPAAPAAVAGPAVLGAPILPQGGPVGGFLPGVGGGPGGGAIFAGPGGGGGVGGGVGGGGGGGGGALIVPPSTETGPTTLVPPIETPPETGPGDTPPVVVLPPVETPPGGTPVTPVVVVPPVSTAPIPEPAGWALMILGFGLAGAALRRRPKQQAQRG